MQIKPTSFIVSVYDNLGRTPEQNAKAHETVKQELIRKGVPHKEVVGQYLGTLENSFLVVGQSFETLVQQLSNIHNQACYMRIHGDNFSELVYNNGRVEGIGTLQTVDADEATQCASWTFDKANNQYYVVR